MMRSRLKAIGKRAVSGKRASVILAKLFPGFFAVRLRQPIFIIGCARSGTSLLTRLLRRHADIANWSEANRIWDPRGYPWFSSDLSTPPVEFDPVAFTERWWRDAHPREQELRAIFGAYQWLSRKPYFLNKSPFNTFRIPHLLALFPDARFIHLVRDGRAVSYSYACKQYEKMQTRPEPYRVKGFDLSFDELAVRLAAFWRACIEEVSRQDEALSLNARGKLIELTYEELCADPTAALDRIYDYAGLRKDHSAVVDELAAVESRNSKWISGFDAELIPRLVSSMEPILSQKGYRDM
jgi:LPS sulfotransferase NodH